MILYKGGKGINRRQFLTYAVGTTIVVGLSLTGFELSRRQGSSTTTTSTSNGSTSTGGQLNAGSRWVWCEPLRGSPAWKVQYSQSQLINYLSQMKFDVLHRGIAQGTSPTEVFTNDSNSIPVVKNWVQLVKSNLGVKITGRIDQTLSIGLDPSDPSLKTNLSSAPPKDLSSTERQNFLADWGIRYHDVLGVDGIWCDAGPDISLANQSADGWNAVYNKIHDAVGKDFIVMTNESSTFFGLRDAIDMIISSPDVSNMKDSINWNSARQQAGAQNGGVAPPICGHIDYPSSIQALERLSISNQKKYLTFLFNDSQNKGWIHHWPMLAGLSGQGYDSMQLGTFDTIVSLVNQIASH